MHPARLLSWIQLFLLDFKPLNPAMAFPPPDSGKADTEAYVEKVYNLSKALEPRGTQDKSDLESHPPFFADSAKGRKDLMNKISKSSSQTMVSCVACGRARLALPM